MNKIIIKEEYWKKINYHFYDQNREHLAYLIVKPISTKNGHRFLVTDLQCIDDVNFQITNEGYQHDPTIVRKMVKIARDKKCILFDIHNHFGSNPNFSNTDICSREKHLSYYYRTTCSNLYGSIVLGSNSKTANAIFWHNNQMMQIDRIDCHGKLFKMLPMTNSSNIDLIKQEIKIYDRQILAFGKEKQKILKAINVVIVGLGGIGSIVATELAYLGIRNFTLIDHDTLEISNTNRVIGSNAKLIGKYKTNICKSHILEITNNEANVTCINQKIMTNEGYDALKNTDFVFLCVDTKEARIFTNMASKTFFVPLFDGQTGIEKEKIFGRFVFVNGETPCLACHNILGANRYMADEKQPSVIHINSMIASIMVLNFHAYVIGIKSPTSINYKFNTNSMHKIDQNKMQSCFACECFMNPTIANLEQQLKNDKNVQQTSTDENIKINDRPCNLINKLWLKIKNIFNNFV